MKSLLKNTFWMILVILIIANTYVFVSGIELSNDINFYEQETRKFHEQNIELDKKTSYLDSLQYAASQAAILDFSKKSTPIQLDNLKYALKL